MAGTDDKVQIGTSADFLEGVSVDTTAGTGLFREGVIVSDPVTPDARARVLNAAPSNAEYGQVVRVAGAVKVDGIPYGTPAYAAGVAATVSVPAGAQVTMISAHATTAATITIGGGATIPLPANMGFADGSTPYVGPLAIVFTGTDSHYVAWVT